MTPEHINPLFPSGQEVNKKICRCRVVLLHNQPSTTNHFHFFVIPWIGGLWSVASEAQTVRFSALKRLQQFLYPSCHVWGCIFVLNGRTSRKIIGLCLWRDTRRVVDSTGMRKCKWLFVNGCESKKDLPSTNDGILKLQQGFGQINQTASGLYLKMIILMRNKWDMFFLTTV